ncbi:hypothetical protein C8J57DRAFT_1509661 [Mycena rebaudengoi]|nr:hypothetical protein C8J57DRAFT_1509661 [Mycena rebaudengoi]
MPTSTQMLLLASTLGLLFLYRVSATLHFHCGTTSDAGLGDCKTMLDQWDSLFELQSTCTFTSPEGCGVETANNVACFGTCCAYMKNNGEPIDKERIKSMATNVLDCADTSKGLVNGVRQDDDHVAVCLGGRDACGDCFDDESDYDPVPGCHRRRSSRAGLLSGLIRKSAPLKK